MQSMHTSQQDFQAQKAQTGRTGQENGMGKWPLSETA